MPTKTRQRRWFVGGSFLVLSILASVVFYRTRKNQTVSPRPQVPKTRPNGLVVPTLPSSIEYEKSQVSTVGDYSVMPENRKLGIEERVVVYGYLVQPLQYDETANQQVARVGFSQGDQPIEADVLFGTSDNSIGVQWVPQGEVRADLSWELTTVNQVARNLKANDHLIIHLALDEKVQLLLDSLDGEKEFVLDQIGPVIQLIIRLDE